MRNGWINADISRLRSHRESFSAIRPGRFASLILLSATCLCPFASLRAGEVQSSDETSPWTGSLATGWDSLYMFRGVNQLPGFEGYGSSISWTGLTLTWTFSEADSLTLGTWAAFGLTDSDYKEIDAFAVYTKTIGDLSLALGYSLYAVINEPNGLYANELNFAAGYDFTIGHVTLTPGVLYAFNLGPAPGNGGYVEQASGYLELRVDADIPVLHDGLSITPWTAFGLNFRYNTTGRNDPPSPFIGTDHIECGVALPIVLSRAVTVAPYVASSFQWMCLPDTAATTFWGGASVAVSF